jgi:cell wall-associated NlpC family hydrolase
MDSSLGHYNMDGGCHEEESRVIRWLEKSGQFTRQASGAQIGDLLCFKWGKVPYHVAVMISERQFVHAFAGACV